MVGRLNQTTQVAVKCPDCGFTAGKIDLRSSSGKPRCSECGKFCHETDKYCASHEVRIDKLTFTDSCPACDEENTIRRRQQEQQARRADPRMHSSVDARRF
jgi:predicted RNA-binding Zn-ribbon protein involved in translation (DUF1610 family)